METTQKKMSPMKKAILSILAVLAAALGVGTGNVMLGSAPSGLPASMASTSQAAIGATVTTLVATSTNCASRIVTTVANPIRLSFGSPDQPIVQPSGTIGHLQAASSTVVYDSGIYGCGLIRVFGYGSDTITISVVQ